MVTPDTASDGDASRSLDVAAWHLQMLLTSVSSFDGKIMFLTALNVAGMSALIGIVITSVPADWIVSLGFALLSMCVVLGLGVLWSANLQQFPSPDEILLASQGSAKRPSELAQRHFAAIQDASERAADALRLRIRTMRSLLALTPPALIIVIAAAVSSAG